MIQKDILTNMEKNTTTHSNTSIGNLTIEDLKKSIACITHYEKQEPMKYEISWFTRFMNKLGWHRKYEVLVLDSEKLRKLGGFYGYS